MNKLIWNIIYLIKKVLLWPIAIAWSWVKHAFESITAPSGYVVLGTIGGIYFTIYSFAQADFERSIQSANTKLGTYVSLASIGDQSSVRFAINNLSQMNSIVVYEKPEFLEPLRWWQETIHRESMTSTWLTERLESCTEALCGHGGWRIFAPESIVWGWGLRHPTRYFGRTREHLDLTNAFFNGSIFEAAYLEGDASNSSFVGSNFRHASLFEIARGADFSHSLMAHANIGNVPSGNDGVFRRQYQEADFSGVSAPCLRINYTDLQGATFFGEFDEEAVEWSSRLRHIRASSSSDLRFSNFEGTNVAGVNFQNANLKFAELQGARNVAQADFAGAIVESGSFLAMRFSDIVQVVEPTEWELSRKEAFCEYASRRFNDRYLSRGWYDEFIEDLAEYPSDVAYFWEDSISDLWTNLRDAFSF